MTFRPALRPGALLLRRDAAHLQIGTSPGTILRDQPGLLAALRLLDGVRDVPRLVSVARSNIPELTIDLASEIHRLHAQGAIIDASAAAMRKRQRDRRLGQIAVSVVSDLGSHDVATAITTATAAAGLVTRDSEPDVVVVLSAGEPARSVFDQFLNQQQVHLVVTIDEDRVRIGPFVIPGVTPCLGCADARRRDFDTAWPALVAQFGRRSNILTPPAVDPLTALSAGVTIADELAAFIDSRPRTCGGILTVGPRPSDRTAEVFGAHARCTCSIFVGATTSHLS